VASRPLPAFEQNRPDEQDGYDRPECDVGGQQNFPGRRNPEQYNHPAEEGSDGDRYKFGRAAQSTVVATFGIPGGIYRDHSAGSTGSADEVRDCSDAAQDDDSDRT
jgi:hypothetical protein